MHATIRWQQAVAFEAESGSGHRVMMDGSPEFGGQNRGSRPMELLLMGLGGCASFDVVTLLKKTRQDITDVRCELQAERADSIPAVFTRIHLHFIVEGRGVKAAMVEKAIQQSAEKYCSASRMLSAGGGNITHDFELIEVQA